VLRGALLGKLLEEWRILGVGLQVKLNPQSKKTWLINYKHGTF
jgi:hypothetical protein